MKSKEFVCFYVMVGGTSAGAPQWAAQQALINAARTTTMSSTGSYIYSDATRAYATDFFDIISGSNGAYFAAPGLDLVTGLGSPNAASFVPDMAAAK